MALRLNRRIIAAGWIAMAVILASGLNTPVSLAEESRILVLLSHDASQYKEALSGFQAHLRKQGVHDLFQVLTLNDDPAGTAETIQKITSGRFNLFFTLGTRATETALDASAGIPIIAGMVSDDAILKRATNITGVFPEFPIRTQFEWLRRFLPKARNIGVIYSAEENRSKIEEAKEVAGRMGLRIVAQKIDSSQDLPDALKTLVNRADVLWGITDNLVLNPQTAKHILLFSFRNRIPFIGLSSAWVKAGALYSLDWDYEDIGAQCGDMALKVLQGGAVGSIPPVSPRHVRYSLNHTTASHMKIKIQEALVKDASSVF